MPVPTTQELLDSVNTAIAARLAGGAVQAYTVNGRNLQRDPIPDLLKLRNELIAQLNAEQSGGGRTYATFGDIGDGS